MKCRGKVIVELFVNTTAFNGCGVIGVADRMLVIKFIIESRRDFCHGEFMLKLCYPYQHNL